MKNTLHKYGENVYVYLFYRRLLQELSAHARMTTGVSKEALSLDYLKPLRDKITDPLVKRGADGIDDSIEVMNKYHLIR